ncbi:MAG: acetolactate decarboxylase [Prevotella sp.]|nr:acetolactate decarboxylase [Candidatus Prevotella equi]
MLKKEKLQHRILQRTSLILIIVSLIIAIVSLVSCSKNDDDNEIDDETENSEYRETMYQVSTLQALLDGGYDGYITVGDLRKHGDIGVGTFDKIDGEMIVVDGTVYQARYDGSVRVADDYLTVPFANVTHFDNDTTITLPKVTSMEDLTAKLSTAIANQNSLSSTGGAGRVLYVARMDIADCKSIHVRSELPQQKPYRPLMEVLKTDQREFTYSHIGGTIVALYFPDFFDKQNSTGWHLHFISADKTKGGHVFDITTSDRVTVHLDATPYYKLYMP